METLLNSKRHVPDNFPCSSNVNGPQNDLRFSEDQSLMIITKTQTIQHTDFSALQWKKIMQNLHTGSQHSFPNDYILLCN